MINHFVIAWFCSCGHCNCAGSVSGKMIVIGGYDGECLDVVEKYDAETDTWKR